MVVSECFFCLKRTHLHPASPCLLVWHCHSIAGRFVLQLVSIEVSAIKVELTHAQVDLAVVFLK